MSRALNNLIVYIGAFIGFFIVVQILHVCYRKVLKVFCCVPDCKCNFRKRKHCARVTYWNWKRKRKHIKMLTNSANSMLTKVWISAKRLAFMLLTSKIPHIESAKHGDKTTEWHYEKFLKSFNFKQITFVKRSKLLSLWIKLDGTFQIFIQV